MWRCSWKKEADTRARSRTWDPPLRRRMLYPLSYAGRSAGHRCRRRPGSRGDRTRSTSPLSTIYRAVSGGNGARRVGGNSQVTRRSKHSPDCPGRVLRRGLSRCRAGRRGKSRAAIPPAPTLVTGATIPLESPGGWWENMTGEHLLSGISRIVVSRAAATASSIGIRAVAGSPIGSSAGTSGSAPWCDSFWPG